MTGTLTLSTFHFLVGRRREVVGWGRGVEGSEEWDKECNWLRGRELGRVALRKEAD